jgi:ABC-type branched-subunit amino acid transport system substrate-binding protein
MRADVAFGERAVDRVAPFLEQLHDAGFMKRGGRVICTYFEENLLDLFPAAHVEGLYGCLDYYQTVSDPFSEALLGQYGRRYPGGPKFTGGSACSGLFRGFKLWEAAVREAGSLDQDAVVRALDHARIAEGPGGPAEMAPGQHHVRMNMYIAEVSNGAFRVVKSLGVVDPGESGGSRAV